MKDSVFSFFIFILLPGVVLTSGSAIRLLWTPSEGPSQMVVELPSRSANKVFSLKYDNPGQDFLVYASGPFTLRSIDTGQELEGIITRLDNSDGGPDVYLTQYQAIEPELIKGWWTVEANTTSVFLATEEGQSVSLLVQTERSQQIWLTIILNMMIVLAGVAAIVITRLHRENLSIDKQIRALRR